MITGQDITFAQEQQEIYQTRINNIRNQPAQGREYFWEINAFAGFTSYQPQQTVNNQLYGSAAINVTPELAVISKAPGSQAVGFFRDFDQNSSNYLNLICGAIEIRRKADYYLFCIVQDTIKKTSSFYIIKDDSTGYGAVEGYWQRLNPIKYKKQTIPITQSNQTVFGGIPTNIRLGKILVNGIALTEDKYQLNGSILTLVTSINPVDKLEITFASLINNFPEEYLFKGTYFDYVIYKSFLLICSGKEEYTDADGFTSGLLMLDLEKFEWMSVPCGKAAPIDFSETAKRLETKIPASYQGDDTSIVINSLEEFNPSIVEEYKERILISGDKSNPYQVKVSEHMNPRNFVDGILGYTVVPNTEEDRRRASTFFCKEIIRSLNTFGDSVLIGTIGKFYNYSLVDLGTADADRVVPDFSSNSGAINNKTCKVFRGGQFYFASNYQILPELNLRVLEQKISAFGNAYSTPTPPEKLTFLIDENCRRYDVSNSTVGIYKNSILWSVASCTNQTGTDNLDSETGLPINPVRNNLTVVYSKIGDTPTYALWNHIRANYFAEIGNRGLIYSSADNGNIYKINEDIYFVDNHIRELDILNDEPYIPNLQDYESAIQTGLVGVARGDGPMSKKKLKRLYFVGGFTGETILEIDVHAVSSSCGDSCCPTLIYSTQVELNDGCEPADCDCNLLPDLNYFRGSKYTKKYIDIPAGTPYNELYITFKVVNSDYFYLSKIGGSYELADGHGFDIDLLLCPRKNEEGNNIIIEKLELNTVTSTDKIVITNCPSCQI